MFPRNEIVIWRGLAITIVSPPGVKLVTTEIAARDRLIARAQLALC